jgi:hypothetical protein
MASPTCSDREDHAMALETTLTTAASTRRALLAGSLGAFVAYVAQALGRPLAARAADGDVIHVGDDLTATSRTRIVNTTNSEDVIYAEATLAGPGDAISGVAVRGISKSNAGVAGSSTEHVGVDGSSISFAGVQGRSGSGVGVHGVGGSAGVFGWSDAGIGVHAQGGGTALRVDGKATFSRSGRLTLTAGQSSIAKTGLLLSRYSLVLAVLQTNRPGIYVRAVVANPSTSSFRVYLNTAVPGTTNVAWFVLN